MELLKDDDTTWEPRGNDVYTSSAGGGLAGASSKIQQLARTSNSLVDLFLFIVPLEFFKKVAMLTHKYCYNYWVVEKYTKMRDDETKKVWIGVSILGNTKWTTDLSSCQFISIPLLCRN